MKIKTFKFDYKLGSNIVSGVMPGTSVEGVKKKIRQYVVRETGQTNPAIEFLSVEEVVLNG